MINQLPYNWLAIHVAQRSQAKKTNAFSFFSINHLFEKDKGTRY